MGGEKKRVEISMVEFDWIYKGDEGLMFVEELADTDDNDILKVFPVKVAI